MSASTPPFASSAVILSAVTTSNDLNGPRDVFPRGNLVFVADTENSALAVYDVTGALPVKISSTVAIGATRLRGVFVQGDYVYLTSQGTPANNFVVFDISNPAVPVQVANKSSANLAIPLACIAAGNVLLVSDLSGHLVSFDISNPVAPVELGVFTISGLGKLPRFAVLDTKAYIPIYPPATTEGLLIVDFSNPASMTQTSFLALPAGSQFADVFVEAGYAYMASEAFGGFTIVDVRNPAAPAVASVTSLPTGALQASTTGLWVSGHTLICGDIANSVFHAYDVSAPATPVYKQSSAVGASAPARMCGQGDYVFVANRTSGGNGGLGMVRYAAPYYTAVRAGGGWFGALRVDGILSAARAAISGAFSVGGFAWFGRDVAIKGNLTVATVNGSAPSRVIAKSAVAASVTGTTAETTLATCTIPANAIGPNGQVEIWSLWSATNNANAKTPRVKFGGTTFYSTSLTTAGGVEALRRFANRNAANSQSVGVSTSAGVGNGAPTTMAIDTTANVDITFTGQLANSADTITLESYLVRATYGA